MSNENRTLDHDKIQNVNTPVYDDQSMTVEKRTLSHRAHGENSREFSLGHGGWKALQIEDTGRLCPQFVRKEEEDFRHGI
jgi:hypothetical protein